mmetsp:Transcript_33098/g.87507  ORF Transcript_33098/g.87507 Transcript_33098/m.87507 type:complete len:226 (-) Transcript_33098:49-726(-)
MGTRTASHLSCMVVQFFETSPPRRSSAATTTSRWAWIAATAPTRTSGAESTSTPWLTAAFARWTTRAVPSTSLLWTTGLPSTGRPPTTLCSSSGRQSPSTIGRPRGTRRRGTSSSESSPRSRLASSSCACLGRCSSTWRAAPSCRGWTPRLRRLGWRRRGSGSCPTCVSSTWTSRRRCSGCAPRPCPGTQPASRGGRAAREERRSSRSSAPGCSPTGPGRLREAP